MSTSSNQESIISGGQITPAAATRDTWTISAGETVNGTGSTYSFVAADVTIYGTVNGGTFVGTNAPQAVDNLNIVMSGATISGTEFNSAMIYAYSGVSMSNLMLGNGGLLLVYEGAVLSGATLSSGGTIWNGYPTGGIKGSGGSLYDITVLPSAYLTQYTGYAQNVTISGVNISTTNHEGGTTYAGATISNLTLIDTSYRLDGIANEVYLSNATLLAMNLASATNVNIYEGGVVSVLGSTELPSVVDGVLIYSGGTLVQQGGIDRNVTIYDGGVQSVYSMGRSYDAIVSGSQYVGSGGTVSGATLNGGTQIIASGANVFSTTANTNGSIVINSGATIDTAIINDGGSLNVASGGTLTNTITLNVGANAVIYADAGGTINLAGDNYNGGLVISGLENGGSSTTVVTIIDGFNGTGVGSSDAIQLAGISAADVVLVEYKDGADVANPDFVTLTLKNGNKITLNIVGAQAAGYTLVDNTNGVIYEVCFLAGSMIKIPGGETAVENLRIGDQVCTYDWKNNQEVSRSVKWVGNKDIKVNTALADDEAGYPIRICKDAVAEGVPYKDLLVTPEHCLFFDGKFVPARMLVNGSSIRYDYFITEYTYYHIETEEHSVIWANEMLTESYLDTGNRKNFRQHGNFVLFNKVDTAKTWNIDASAPLVTERSYVEPLYNQLQQRALNNGLQQTEPPLLTTDCDLHLVTDTGEVIKPHKNSINKYSFLLSEGVKEVYIKSRTSRPCDVVGSFVDDRRELGVLIGNINIISLNQQYLVTDHLFEDDLQGWEDLESTPSRWTKGNAKLNLNQKSDQKRVLVVEVLSSNSYFVEDKKEVLAIKKIA